MFQHQGPARSARHNRVVAGYLAFVGGYVNSAGYVLIGSFTSHVTGNVGRFANDLAFGQYGAAVAALPMLVAFFAGAFTASMAIESNVFGKTSNAYAAALFAECALLVLFIAASNVPALTHANARTAAGVILCAAMGMQNSLVTRLSGAVVRTTHLTGVFTDLGIESARWFRWWRGALSERVRMRLAFGRNPIERPAPPKIALLATIAATFIAGAMAGAALAVKSGRSAMALPAIAVAACGVYALGNRRREGHDQEAGAPDTRR